MVKPKRYVEKTTIEKGNKEEVMKTKKIYL